MVAYQHSSGIAVGHGILTGMLGGLSPLISLKLIQYTHNIVAPAFYIMGGAIIALLGIILFYKKFIIHYLKGQIHYGYSSLLESLSLIHLISA